MIVGKEQARVFLALEEGRKLLARKTFIPSKGGVTDVWEGDEIFKPQAVTFATGMKYLVQLPTEETRIVRLALTPLSLEWLAQYHAKRGVHSVQA